MPIDENKAKVLAKFCADMDELESIYDNIPDDSYYKYKCREMFKASILRMGFYRCQTMVDDGNGNLKQCTGHLPFEDENFQLKARSNMIHCVEHSPFEAA